MQSSSSRDRLIRRKPVPQVSRLLSGSPSQGDSGHTHISTSDRDVEYMPNETHKGSSANNLSIKDSRASAAPANAPDPDEVHNDQHNPLLSWSQESCDTASYPSRTRSGHDNEKLARGGPDLTLGAPGPRMWNTKWLRPATILSLGVLNIALLVNLVLLFHFVQQNNGLSTQLSSNHYSWTYGPTALLVLVLGLWRQVDFACKILSPWKKLAGGASNAIDTLLLDYISPIVPTVIWSAVCKRDWGVLASSCGVLLLRVVIIFSTGLLVLTPTPMSDYESTFLVNTKFSGSAYDPDSITSTLGGSAGMAYYGIWKEGLAYPYGAAGSFAYETIAPYSPVANSTLIAAVNGFYPELDCRITPLTSNISFEVSRSDAGVYDMLFLTYTARPVGCPTFSSSFADICNPIYSSCPSQAIIADLFQGYTLYGDTAYSQRGNVAAECWSFWFWIIAQVHYDRRNDAPANSSSGWNVTYTNLTALTCFPSYSIKPLNVTMDVTNHSQMTGIKYSEPLTESSSMLFNYSSANFSDTMFVLDDYESNNLAYNDTLAILLVRNTSLTEADLLDPYVFRDSVVDAFKGYASQAVHQSLRENTNRNTTGATQYLSQRLQVRPVSVWVMFGGFVALLICMLVVLWFRPRGVISRNPNAIATHAAVLSTSPQLEALVTGTRSLTSEALRKTLQRLNFASTVVPIGGRSRYSVQAHPTERTSLATASARGDLIASWWTPFSISIIFMIWVLSAPVAIIVVLEVLQNISDSNRGILNIHASSMVARSAAPILTSLIMVLVAMSYDSLEFAILTFSPYRTLKKGAATAKNNLLANSVGQLPLYTILDSLRRRCLIAAIASVAATMGSFLTIISSGLYTIETVQYPHQLAVSAADGFASQWHNSSHASTGSLIFDLLEHENATYPPYTFDELVFPRLLADSVRIFDRSKGQTLQMAVPARRAALNCTMIPKENITVTLSDPAPKPNSLIEWSTAWNFVAGVPDSCPEFRNLSHVRTSTIPFGFLNYWDGDGPESLNMASILDQNAFGYQDAYGPNGTAQPAIWNGVGAASNSPDCPSLGFYYGIMYEQNVTKNTITAMLCTQGFQEVQTNTTFILPDMSISSSQPPIIDETSARWITSIDGIGIFLNQTSNFRLWYDGSDPPYQLDGFFQTLLYGTDAIPFHELVGPANEEKLFTAIQHVYRKYMAQAINANMRVLFTDNAPEYTAVLPESTQRLRLVQHKPSKIILQVLLGLMLLCALIVYPSTRSFRRMLPRCPWSMLGMMTLLAGSDMCDKKVMPEGAEFMTDRELEMALHGWLFSLGWWGVGSAERYSIDVGRARQENGDQCSSFMGRRPRPVGRASQA
jgi:hypothetical protein